MAPLGSVSARRNTRIAAVRSSSASRRTNSSQDGTRRVYQFKKTDDHGLELAILARQLSSAGWVGRERFPPASVTPT